jgi:hypothetical protein
MDHMAFEFERIFDHNSMPGKVVWIIDMKGMREWAVVIWGGLYMIVCCLSMNMNNKYVLA